MALVKIIMLMAGEGKRFFDAGHTMPKPLIEIKGKPMFKWAAESLPFNSGFIFIVRQEHIDKHKIDKVLLTHFPGAGIIAAKHLTKGPAATALLAKKHIKRQTPVIITDCDHYFSSKEYNRIVTTLPENIDGAIPVFPAKGERWSFSKISHGGRISKIAEKNQISGSANLGAYFFRKGEDFIWSAEKMIKENQATNGEFYIAPTYNYLIERGAIIMAASCERHFGIGTPEDIGSFLAGFKK